LFPQTRDLFLIGFAAWLGLCVYVGGLLDGNRAYGAVLSGYTVAVVAVAQIDAPQNVFTTGVNRGAATWWELPRSLWSVTCSPPRTYIRA
jgi:uncharacterized membrane protein YccC